MSVITGKIVNGRIEVENAAELPEGATVEIFIAEDDGYDLTPEDEAELEDRVAAVHRGEFVTAEQLLTELRSRR
ncbi:MAG TPA: hypothetical protein VF618_04120 [Thermoanaerobaculia bacterium]